MNKLVSSIVKTVNVLNTKVFLLMCSSMLFSQELWAQIPISDDIKEKAEDGDYFNWIQWVIDRMYVIILGIVGMVAFLYVAWGALTSFWDWRKDKIEFGEMMGKIGISVVVLVVVIVIVGIANGLVTTSS
jgi:hypothetical protein